MAEAADTASQDLEEDLTGDPGQDLSEGLTGNQDQEEDHTEDLDQENPLEPEGSSKKLEVEVHQREVGRDTVVEPRVEARVKRDLQLNLDQYLPRVKG